jgi:hypothetical protein
LELLDDDDMTEDVFQRTVTDLFDEEEVSCLALTH